MTSYLRHVFRVRIYDPSSDEPDKRWTFDDQRFPYVTSVGIRTEAENQTSNSISISFDAPFEVGKRMLSSSMFRTKNLVEARVGYIDGGTGGRPRMSPWFYGFLAKGGEGLSLSPTGLSGTITATGKGRASFFDEIRSNVTFDEGLQDLFDLNNWGFAPGTDQTTIREKLKAMRVSRMLNPDEFVDELSAMLNVRLVDAPELNEQGQLVKRLEFADKVSADKVLYTFVMRGAFDPAESKYPIVNFSATLDGGRFTFKSAAATGATSGMVDKAGEMQTTQKEPKDSAESQGNTTNESPEVAEGPVPGESTTQAAIADRPPNNERERMAFFADRAVGDIDVQTMETVTQSLVDQAMVREGLPAKLEILGLPEAQPWRMCAISNCGALFDGAYKITSVEHMASVTDFKTTLELKAQTEKTTAGKNPDAQQEAKATNG